MRFHLIGAGVLGALLLAGSARAEDLLGEWDLEGRHALMGPVRTRLVITEAEGALLVNERMEQGGGAVLRRWKGARGEPGQASLRPQEGFASAVVDGADTVRLDLRLSGPELIAEVHEPGGETILRGMRHSEGLGRARDLFSGGKGKLLVLAERELKKRAYEGAKLDEDFGVSQYFHLGLGVAVRALPPEQQTPDQRQALTQLGRPGAWIASEIHGGVRLPVGATLDLGHGIALGLGFEPGARARYLVHDMHELPGGLSELENLVGTIRDVAVRSVDLPLEPEEARGLTLGAQRVLEGEAYVALSGSLSLGREVRTFGEDVVRIGASAVLGGAYRLSGVIRFEVTRLSGDDVRLRVTRGTSHTRSASADLLLGATLGESWARTHMAPGVEWVSSAKLREKALDAVVSGAASAVRDAVRIQLVGGVTNTDSDELELIWRYDLSRAPAAEAYRRAMRGDLTVSEAAAREPGSGVVQEFRVHALEERTWAAAELRVSVLFKAGFSKAVEVSDLDVIDLGGRTRYEVFRFSRARHWKLALAKERRRGLTVEVVRAAPEGGTVCRALRYVLDVVDPATFAWEADRVRRALDAWGLSSASSLPAPDRPWFRSAYGPTRTQLVVEIGEEGVAAILDAGRQKWLEAYVTAFTRLAGEAPTWATEHGRANLEFPGGNGDSQQERYEYSRAKDFVDGMEALATGTTPEARADALRALASAARWDLHAVTALVQLTPREALRVSGSLAGDLIATDSNHLGSRFEAGALFGLPPRDVVRARALEAGKARVDEPVAPLPPPAALPLGEGEQQ